MKILHIISSLKTGGAEQALCNLLNNIRHEGNDHIVAFFHAGPHIETLNTMGVPHVHIKGLIHPFDPAAFFQLKKLIRTISPDILHTSLWGANIMGRILGYQLGIPVISDLHGNSIDEGFLRNILDRLTAPLSDCIIAVSPTVHTSYQSHIINKIPIKKMRNKVRQSLVTIKNGIDITTTKNQAFTTPLSRQAIGLDPDAFVIGAVGRLEPIKSYDVLIKAFHYAIISNKQSNMQLCIVGDGSQASSLYKLVKKLKIEQHVIFTGMRRDALRLYPLFDCFALSSQSEGLSIALLEALCFGLPIITTHHSNHHDVLTDGIHGFVVPPNNPIAFGQALNRLQQSITLQHAIKEKNMALVQNSYGIDTMSKHYLKAYIITEKNTKRNK